MDKLRAPAIPLITVDPHFNIWSFSDNLYDDTPRHWTGARQNMLGVITVDGEHFRFMGKVQTDGVYPREPKVIRQTDVTITPLKTIYTFENDKVELKLEFMTPLLLDDLKLASRPVSYISYSVASKDGKEHDIKIDFYISTEASVNTNDQSITAKKYQNGAFCGRGINGMLAVSGDDRRIDWGYLHFFSKDHDPVIMDIDSIASQYAYRGRKPGKVVEFDEEGEFYVRDRFVSLGLTKSFKLGKGPYSNFICAAYDDIHSIMYFNKPIDAYYKKDGDTFEDICKKAIDEYSQIVNRVSGFEEELLERAGKVSTKYADIISLAYRQTIAAHKITWDGEEIQFFSKECYSNGCIGTVDVTYPSIPLFLIFNPDLVCGMLNPIFKYAGSEAWPYDFAPHDVGQYPLANGQVYGLDRQTNTLRYDKQMPVEECGNMIICVAAVCHAKGELSYAEKHLLILKKWTDYLMQYGLDPENQLCTDDFAGHLAHNCNLSVKAIIGIACFGDMIRKIGDKEEGDRYINIARKYANEWKKKAFDKDHYRLAFDREDTWSIKYNLIWDKIFKLDIFDSDIFETEVQYYLNKVNQFGLPLDSRSDYTKSDWQMWSTRLTDNKRYENAIIDAMWDMLNETESRVPFADWYYTSTGEQIMFQNRTVQGGLFINLL